MNTTNEQPVPRDVRSLAKGVYYAVSRSAEDEAVAVIIYAMERFAEQKNAELKLKLDEANIATDFADAATELVRRNRDEEIDQLRQQLAALQRENETLKRSPENARYHRTATSEKEGE